MIKSLMIIVFNEKFIILLLYVDGMVMVGHDMSEIQSLKRSWISLLQ